MKQCILLLLITISWGCTHQKKDQVPKLYRKLKNLTVFSTSTKPNKTISFNKDAIYGNSKNHLIGRMGDLAVDDSGRIFLADVQNMSINVFESNGRFTTKVGRKGKGPGEFAYIKGLYIRKNFLYIYDSNPQQIVVFGLDSLNGDKTIFLARNRGEYQALNNAFPWIHKLYVRNNGTFLAEFILHSSKSYKKWQNTKIKGLLYVLDNTGKIASHKLIDFIEDMRTFFRGFGVPMKFFFGNALTVLSKDNRIYWAGPEYFLIKVYSPDGVFQRAFYYPHKKIPITRESAISVNVPDLVIKSMKSMDLPQNWPVLRHMKIDDQDRLWVATTIKNMKVFEWWVLKPNGQLIARFNWPRSKPIQVIKNGYMYTKEKNNDGLEVIVRYRIKMIKMSDKND